MARSRSFVALVGAGVLGLTLVGVGASATFTDSVSASQSITAGTLNVDITSTAPGATSSKDGRTLTLKSAGPVGSTYATDLQTISIKNNGNIAATASTVAFSASTNGAAGNLLRDGTTVTITYAGVGYPIPLTTLIAHGTYDLATLVPSIPAEARTLAVGSAPVEFGITFSATNLASGAQGGVVIPKLTVVGIG